MQITGQYVVHKHMYVANGPSNQISTANAWGTEYYVRNSPRCMEDQTFHLQIMNSSLLLPESTSRADRQEQW